jgi:hypothetical protein
MEKCHRMGATAGLGALVKGKFLVPLPAKFKITQKQAKKYRHIHVCKACNQNSSLRSRGGGRGRANAKVRYVIYVWF